MSFPDSPHALEAVFIQRDLTNDRYDQINISGSDLIIYLDSTGKINADKIETWAANYRFGSGSGGGSSLGTGSTYPFTSSWAITALITTASYLTSGSNSNFVSFVGNQLQSGASQGFSFADGFNQFIISGSNGFSMAQGLNGLISLSNDTVTLSGIGGININGAGAGIHLTGFTTGFTGSVYGTSSVSISSSYASTASISTSASFSITSSYALTGGSGGGTSLGTGSTYPITSSWANSVISASYAGTASSLPATIRTNTIIAQTGGGSSAQVRVSQSLLQDQSNGTSVDWQNRLLYQSGTPQKTVDWNNTILVDGNNVNCQNWGARLLYDTSQTSSVDYGNRVLEDAGQNVVVDWNNYILGGHGAWAITASKGLLGTSSWSQNSVSSSVSVQHITSSISASWASSSLSSSFASTIPYYTSTQAIGGTTSWTFASGLSVLHGYNVWMTFNGGSGPFGNNTNVTVDSFIYDISGNGSGPYLPMFCVSDNGSGTITIDSLVDPSNSGTSNPNNTYITQPGGGGLTSLNNASYANIKVVAW